MNRSTIRRICDSVDPDWVDVKVVPKEEDRGRVKAIMEELGYTVEDEGDAIVVHTQYPEDTEKTIKDILDKGKVEYTISSGNKVQDAVLVEGFDEIREAVGDTVIVDELQQYMSTDDLEEFVDHLRKVFDMD